MCPFDGEACPIELTAICHHCHRFNAHHAENLPRLGKIDRSLLLEGLTTNYDKNYLFPELTESQAVSRRRSLAKLQKCGFVVWDIHTSTRNMAWSLGGYKEITRRIPRLTPLGHFITTAILPNIEANKPIRWSSIKPLAKTLGDGMEAMIARAITHCQNEIVKSQKAIVIFAAHSSTNSFIDYESQKIDFYSRKLKSLNVTPTETIRRA